MSDTALHFEGHQPRECGEHRSVGAHRAYCYDCHMWCYPRIEAACHGCRNPVIEKLLDDMADVLGEYFDDRDGRYILQEDYPLPDVVAVVERYRAYKGEE